MSILGGGQIKFAALLITFILVMAYSSGKAQCPQNDIYVNSNTWWIDQTINMCPGQNIWIGNGATLIIWNSTIRLDPSMTGSWGGIFVQNGCSLSIVAQSVIRDANEAIRGLDGFATIRVWNSTITNVGSVIYAVSFVPGLGTQVSFSNCTLRNRENSGTLFVGANGVNMQLTRCDLWDVSSRFNVGIDGFNNRVRLVNCNLYSFERCINKGVGGNASHTGLIMDGCNIGSLPQISVFNNDIAVTAFNCIFVGGVYHVGTSMGSWERNNFEDLVSIAFPTLSHTFYENRFGHKLNLLGAQDLTDARCDYWPNSGYAVDGYATTIKSDWGFHGVSSGNWHANGIVPVMTIISGNPIANHYISTLPQEIFAYGGQFRGQIAGEPYTCQQRWRHIVMAAIESDTITYDDNDNNTLWNTYYQSYQNALTQLNGADPSTDPALRCQLEDAQVGMGQTVLKAILYSENITESSLNTWTSRADPFLNIRTQIMNLFVSQSFTALSSYLISLSLTGAESNDRNVFNNAVLWMKQAKEDEKDLYNLSSTDLATLTNYASSNFGDYTAVLRGWLSINYFIYIDPPPYSNNLKGKPNKGIESQAFFDTQIVPRYSDGCLTILTNNEIKGMAEIEIISLEGKNLYNGKWDAANSNCIPIKLTAGVYKIRISNSELKKTIIKSFIIN